MPKRKREEEIEGDTMSPNPGGSASPRAKTEPEIYEEDYEQYIVFVKSDNFIKQITLATKLFKIKGENILNIIPLNGKTCKVLCVDKFTANDLVLKQPVKEVTFYIPYFIKYSYGILKGKDTDIDEKDIILMLQNQAKIKSVYRFTKKLADVKNAAAQNFVTMPTNTIKVELETDQIPEYVHFYSLRVKVHQYYPRLRRATSAANTVTHKRSADKKKNMFEMRRMQKRQIHLFQLQTRTPIWSKQRSAYIERRKNWFRDWWLTNV